MTDAPLPRFDKDVKYRIHYGLFVDIMSLLGFPLLQLCTECAKNGRWIAGDDVKNLLDLLNEMGDERALGLSSELYITVAEPEPEPPELQEVE